MPTGWRLIKTKYADTAFTGEGARLYGARWNSPGVRVAYASETISLAMLEVLVHAAAGELLPFYSRVSARIPEDLVQILSPKKLPANWRDFPSPAETAAVGDEWVAAGRSAVLMVPSVLVEEEHNFLINPAHPEFARITVGKPEPFPFDHRLKK